MKEKITKVEEELEIATNSILVIMRGEEAHKRALQDFVTPRVQGLNSRITRPNMEANNFEIRRGLVNMVQQN